eukprot:scaffold4436_cov108-Cylindrotheca_fusiformis.AAC.1
MTVWPSPDHRNTNTRSGRVRDNAVGPSTVLVTNLLMGSFSIIHPISIFRQHFKNPRGRVPLLYR